MQRPRSIVFRCPDLGIGDAERLDNAVGLQVNLHLALRSKHYVSEASDGTFMFLSVSWI